MTPTALTAAARTIGPSRIKARGLAPSLFTHTALKAI